MLCDPLGHGLLLTDHMGESCWEGRRPAEQMCVCDGGDGMFGFCVYRAEERLFLIRACRSWSDHALG